MQKVSEEGLVRGIRQWDLVGVVINSIIGAGIFVLPARSFKLIGSYSLIAFVLCAFVTYNVIRSRTQSFESGRFVLLRVFRVFRGSLLCSIKNDPRKRRNTRNTRINMKVLYSTFEAKPNISGRYRECVNSCGATNNAESVR